METTIVGVLFYYSRGFNIGVQLEQEMSLDDIKSKIKSAKENNSDLELNDKSGNVVLVSFQDLVVINMVKKPEIPVEPEQPEEEAEVPQAPQGDKKGLIVMKPGFKPKNEPGA